MSDNPHQTDYVLLSIGLILVIIPLGFVIAYSDYLTEASLYLRVIISLGGALVGSSIPGLLQIHFPGIRAAGALAILVLLWQTNPPQALNKVISNTTRYEYVGGYFEKTAIGWGEYKTGQPQPIATFNEIKKDNQYFYINDPSRIMNGDQQNSFVIRIPVKGGQSHWSWTFPEHWNPLYTVTLRDSEG
jgi:hypothetical protein